MPTPSLVKAAEAARLLGRSEDTVRRLALRRRITYFRDPDTGSWLFSRESIEAYINGNLVPAREPVDLTPVRRQRKQRVNTAASAPAAGGDEPWRGSIFGPRDGTTTPARRTRRRPGAASSAATTDRAANNKKASESR